MLPPLKNQKQKKLKIQANTTKNKIFNPDNITPFARSFAATPTLGK